MAQKKTKANTSYDEAIQELEKIISGLQTNEKKFDEVLQEIEKAVSLYHHCKERLHASEQRLEALFADENDM